LIIPGSNPPDTAWFACLGLPLSPADLRDARAYLSALGCSEEIEIRPVPGWRDAESILRSSEWDARWWQREDDERADLLRKINARLGEAVARERLSAVTELNGELIHGAAAIAAARDGGADAALIRCASGAAAMAMHEHAAAQLADCGSEHLFMRKYRLFESGRWPLCVLRDKFYLF
jgi:hypothetical protein